MAHDLTNTSALHNGLVHDAVDADCHTHGSALSKSTVNQLHHETDFKTDVSVSYSILIHRACNTALLGVPFCH